MTPQGIYPKIPMSWTSLSKLTWVEFFFIIIYRCLLTKSFIYRYSIHPKWNKCDMFVCPQSPGIWIIFTRAISLDMHRYVYITFIFCLLINNTIITEILVHFLKLVLYEYIGERSSWCTCIRFVISSARNFITNFFLKMHEILNAFFYYCLFPMICKQEVVHKYIWQNKYNISTSIQAFLKTYFYLDVSFLH